MSTDSAGGRPNPLVLYSLKQVIEMTGWSPSHLRRAIRAGKLVVHDFGRSIRISQADLEAFLNSTRRSSKKVRKTMTGNRVRKTSA
jgi:excisionase family DNA binding protein